MAGWKFNKYNNVAEKINYFNLCLDFFNIVSYIIYESEARNVR